MFLTHFPESEVFAFETFKVSHEAFNLESQNSCSPAFFLSSFQ